MTVYPFQLTEVMHTYSRLSSQRPASPFDREEQAGPRDEVTISTEAKKRQALDQARRDAEPTTPAKEPGLRMKDRG